MLLCIDVGNSHLFAGLYRGDELLFRFRYSTHMLRTSDELGVFLCNVIRENGVDPARIEGIAIGSVVPAIDYALVTACQRYFSCDPFILHARAVTGLRIDYPTPYEIGADLLATAIAAANQFPNRHRIVVDFGTATTLCPVTKENAFLGGAILPGMRLSMEALQGNTAKLLAPRIEAPEHAVGQTTAECIQSGVFYGHIGAIKEVSARMTEEIFPDQKPMIIATGGFSKLWEGAGIFDVIDTDLVLKGLRTAFMLSVQVDETLLAEIG